MVMKMKKIIKSAGKIVISLTLTVLLLWIACAVGQQIFKARYFKNLDDVHLGVIEEHSEGCPLHEKAPSNFPLLVNINEGSVAELRLYDTYVEYPIQIRENTTYGVGWNVGGTGWSGLAIPDTNIIHFSIHRNKMYKYSFEAARLFFCDDCIKAFRELDPSCNFIIVDGYEKDNLKYYDIANIEDLQIRHYSFLVKEKGYDLFSLEMHSSYFDGGKELDFLNKDDTTEMDKRYENLP